MPENRIDPTAAPKKRKLVSIEPETEELPGGIVIDKRHKGLIILLGATILGGVAAAAPFVSGPIAIGLAIGSGGLGALLSAIGWRK